MPSSPTSRSDARQTVIGSGCSPLARSGSGAPTRDCRRPFSGSN
ncbi:hypothetical protein N5K55_07420 [Pseudomonas aeruginosa]|nr:hypothetical protein [Pseudomonas aeruginosa]